MNKEDREKKRRQKVENRLNSAFQSFINEIKRADHYRWYKGDLDDLEMLTRYFEGCSKCIRKLNNKAQKIGKPCEPDLYEEDKNE